MNRRRNPVAKNTGAGALFLPLFNFTSGEFRFVMTGYFRTRFEFFRMAYVAQILPGRASISVWHFE